MYNRQRKVVKLPAPHDTLAEVFDHHVSRVDKFSDNFMTGGLRQVNGNTSFVPIEG